jgi:queuine tRNA-ribosyltransferase
MANNFSFEIIHECPRSLARSGILSTPHGMVHTPNFIFCATKGALKSLSTADLAATGAEIMLSNTYHLTLQPGAAIVEKHGGLHGMLGWKGPMLTDSGGFQIFSLGHGGVANEIKGRRSFSEHRSKSLLKITEEGAFFRSYVDGTRLCLTPEMSIRVQKKFGADLVLAFDECTPFNVSKDYTARAMRRSHRWESRSLVEFEKIDDGTQALYGIIQGGVHEDLRRESAEFIAGSNFFGQAVGGSLGGTKEEMHAVVAMVGNFVARGRPTHLLGIGGLSDIWNGVKNGMDTFDCVYPTRLARHGGALCIPHRNEGREFLNLNNARFREDMSPVDGTCDCYCCKNFSRSYVHHLFKAGEMLGGQLLTIHNARFIVRMMATIRQSIENGTFLDECNGWMSG